MLKFFRSKKIQRTFVFRLLRFTQLSKLSISNKILKFLNKRIRKRISRFYFNHKKVAQRERKIFRRAKFTHKKRIYNFLRFYANLKLAEDPKFENFAKSYSNFFWLKSRFQKFKSIRFSNLQKLTDIANPKLYIRKKRIFVRFYKKKIRHKRYARRIIWRLRTKSRKYYRRTIKKAFFSKKKYSSQFYRKFAQNSTNQFSSTGFGRFKSARLARLVKYGKFLSKRISKGIKNIIAIRIIKTYNNFFVALQTSQGQNLFSYSSGRVDLRRNRRLTKQALEIAARNFSFALRRRKFKKFNITVVGRTTYHTRIFIRNMRQYGLKISAINFILKRAHNGLRIRASRRV